MKKPRETEEEDIMARLNERVEKAIATIQELRRERDALRAKLEEAESRLSPLEDDCARYEKERGEIRSRIETMLSNLESLDG